VRRLTFKVWQRRIDLTHRELIAGNESQIETLKAEGMHRILHGLYIDLLQAYVAYSDKAKVQKYGQLVLEKFERMGPSFLEQEKVDLGDIRNMTENPEEHWLWGYGYNREKLVKVDVPAGSAKNPVPPKDYSQFMYWSMPDFSKDGPLRQVFNSMNARQQTEFMRIPTAGGILVA
jgi:hypothetical protein